jgi:hypothetical protein
MADLQQLPEPGHDAWTRWRDPGTGLGLELPAAWSTRVGWLKEYRILGVRVQRPPQWLATPGAAWNLLESTLPDTCAAVSVHIDPITLPASLAEVLDSRLARVMGLRIVASDAAVRVGSFEGFSTTADLHGVLGGRVELGPISVSTAGIKDRLRLTQTWLRRTDAPDAPQGRCVHLQCVTPSDADSLRQSLGRVLSSLRQGG